MNTKPNFNGISYMSIEEIRRFIGEKRIDKSFCLSSVVSNDNSGKSQIGINVSASFVGGNCRIDKVESNAVSRPMYDDCKNVIEWIKSDDNDLNSYNKLYEGDYFTIKMPMYSGVLVYENNKNKSNVKYWFGYYRDLKLYLIENLNNESSEKSNDNKDCLEKDLDSKFIMLYDNIKKKVDNREFSIDFSFDFKKYFEQSSSIKDEKFGWVEMLIKCDKYKMDNFGTIEIFGTPLIVSKFVQPGYGWYEVYGNTYGEDCIYYEYDGNEITGNILKTIPGDSGKKYFDMDINYLRYILEFPKDKISLYQKKC